MTTPEKIKKILEREIAPMLAMHNGAVEFVNYKAGVVRVRLKGTCHGCSLAELTLKEGIETILKEKVPTVKSVENIG